MVQRLSALDALGRALANVRANWELLLAQAAATVALAALLVASLLPLGIALGWTLAGLAGSPAEALSQLADPATWLSAGVLAALAGATLLGTLAIAVYAWFQAGIFGVLAAGDRQAGSGPRRPWALYRTFGWSDLAGWAGHGFSRFFGWYHLYLLIVTGAMALFGALLLAAVLVGRSQGVAAGFGLGCGGLLPLLFLLLYVSLVAAAAKADLARDGSGAASSWRRGGRVVARRLGASLLLFVLLLAASTAASTLLLPLQLLSELGLGEQLGAYLAVQLVVAAVQTVLGTLLGLVYGAAFVALVRAELPDPA